MWSSLLLWFVFYHNNDSIPRFKRGPRSFGVLAVAVTIFLAVFVATHQDEAQVNSTSVCPAPLDLTVWIGVDMALAVSLFLDLNIVSGYIL